MDDSRRTTSDERALSDLPRPTPTGTSRPTPIGGSGRTRIGAIPAVPPAPRGVNRRALVLTGLLTTASLAGCNTGRPAATAESPTATAARPPASSAPPPHPTATTAATTPDPLEGWTLEQKVGQLLMVGVDASAPQASSIEAVSTYHVGNIFIAGRVTSGSQAVSQVVADFTALVGPDSTHDAPLLVATDQEGGEVQVLRGPGFSEIPSAGEQATWPDSDLLAGATAWGEELAAAGITMNLAPVADLVDMPDPSANGPIGKWNRNYGTDATTVLRQAQAFARGMETAGVLATYKHFPGLGRVYANTDTAAQVTDEVTTRSDDPALSVFAEAITGGARAVMVSSAVYSLIDPTTPALFSQEIVTGILREDLGFTGLIVTDDVSAALQVLDLAPGDRAVGAVRAGCDLVLASGDPSVAAPMAEALIAEAQTDPAFAARVDESARRILALKAEHLP